jgi:hypothetical protein
MPKKTIKPRQTKLSKSDKLYADLFPEGTSGEDVAILQTLVNRCTQEIERIQKDFYYPSLCMKKKEQKLLAEVIVDFTLDVHSGSGIWDSLEQYNLDLFGTPLPLVLPKEQKLPTGLCLERIQFLLWNIFPQVNSGLLLSHKHIDLVLLARELTPFLQSILPELPAVSPIKTFLDTPNDYGWQVKKKLIWLGMSSYLFRFLYREYVEVHTTGQFSIGIIDDFLCQETTAWSGLGTIDILAGMLPVSPKQKEEMRNWYLRHASIYKITAADSQTMDAVNLLNNVLYRIRHASPAAPATSPIKTNQTVFGSLVPWNGEWYWSGEQHYMTLLSPQQLEVTIKRYKQNTQVVARYCEDVKESARKMFVEEYQRMIDHYKKNFVVFPNNRKLEEEEIKRYTRYAASIGRMGELPQMKFTEVMPSGNIGIGIFIDPVEGMEMMDYFNDVQSGLKLNGKCNEDEEAAIRGMVVSSNICPAFVKRVLQEYGGERTVQYVFRWDTDEPYWLDYLLRCYKGENYRRRFPPISVLDRDLDD